MALADQCMEFACEMMDLCRGTREVEAVLADSSGENPMARLQMAIKYEEKKVHIFICACSISSNKYVAS